MRRNIVPLLVAIFFAVGCITWSAWHIGWQRGYEANEPYIHHAFESGKRIGHNEEHLKCSAQQDAAYDRGYADGAQSEIHWRKKQKITHNKVVGSEFDKYGDAFNVHYEIDQIHPKWEIDTIQTDHGVTVNCTPPGVYGDYACVNGYLVPIIKGCEPGSVAGQYLCTGDRKWIKLCYTNDGARVGGNANCTPMPLPQCTGDKHDGTYANSPCIAADSTVW